MGVLVHKRILSALKRVEFVSNRMSYIILIGRWCNIIVLNVHAPIDDIKKGFYEKPEDVFDKFPKYHMKILLGDFNVKVGRENIFKPTIIMRVCTKFVTIMESRVVNFATSKNLTVKSTMFLHRNIHKLTSTSPDGKTHNHPII
jgi:hypothetical protein